MPLQSPDAVVMVRPLAFTPNPETAADNSFQCPANGDTAPTALSEFDNAVRDLRAAGATVHVFTDDGDLNTPDSVFPNNWFSTHTGGHIAIFPMFAPSRQRERRADIIEFLKSSFRVQDVIDYSGLEQDKLTLEGTGAMVLDHLERVAYTVQSNRADPVLLERFCTHFNYEPMVFEARDAAGTRVYHTNVLMTVGTGFALVCLDMIVDPHRRTEIADRLRATGRDVIELSHEQIGQFAGNALELGTANGPVLALSTTALNALTNKQKSRITRHARLVPLHVPTIERAGGSVRCMLAGIHLSARPTNRIAL